MFGRKQILESYDALRQAERRIPRLAFEYICGGNDRGPDKNGSLLRRWHLVPQAMVDVRKRSAAKSILGQQFDLPMGITPMGGANLAWPGTDQMLAEQAAKRNFPLCASTVATSSMEDIYRWSDGNAWFQLYYSGEGELAKALCKRAWSAGYRTLVLTVDVPVLGRRVEEKRAGFTMPFRMTPRTFTDFAMHPRWSLSMLAAGKPDLGNFTARDAEQGYVWDRTETRGGLNWDWFRKLRDGWSGNLVVKGVLDVELAKQLKAEGADAIQVSTHGGRQLAGGVQSVSVLPEMRAALGDDFPILYDSGVRSGDEVLKLLALGADYVFTGRYNLYAAGAGQRTGLDELWDCWTDELDIAMAMCGLTGLDQVSNKILKRVEER